MEVARLVSAPGGADVFSASELAVDKVGMEGLVSRSGPQRTAIAMSTRV
jgi:hypothetical protein